jgi:hypothetical protein
VIQVFEMGLPPRRMIKMTFTMGMVFSSRRLLLLTGNES